MTYQSKISSTMIINKKTGDVRLEEFEVSVDGYKNKRKLRKAKDAYKRDKGIEKEYKSDEWPKDMWYYLFEEYFKRLEEWKKIFKKENRKI